MNLTVDSSPAGNKWSFSHQAGIGHIQEAFPQINVCAIQVQDMT